jgi:hypothetical protein
MRGMIVAFAIVLTGCAAQPQTQDSVDPQAYLDSLLRRTGDADGRQAEERRQNDATRLRYQRASNEDLIAEYTRYCPVFGQPCVRSAPDLLVAEAERRGLIGPVPIQQQPRQPGIACVAMPDGMGGGIATCR